MSGYYKLHPWNAPEDMRQVRFVAEPGAFEGESVFAVAFDAAASFANQEFGDATYGGHYLCFRPPFDLNALDEVKVATDGGLTETEEEVLNEAEGAILRTDSRGFRWLLLLSSRSEYEAVTAELEEQAAEEQGWE
jgi:hypothetical protein